MIFMWKGCHLLNIFFLLSFTSTHSDFLISPTLKSAKQRQGIASPWKESSYKLPKLWNKNSGPKALVWNYTIRVKWLYPWGVWGWAFARRDEGCVVIVAVCLFQKWLTKLPMYQIIRTMKPSRDKFVLLRTPDVMDNYCTEGLDPGIFHFLSEQTQAGLGRHRPKPRKTCSV